MRDFFVFTMITKTRPWRHIYQDIEIPRPKTQDIEISRPKNYDIEIPRPKNHDIEKQRQIYEAAGGSKMNRMTKRLR